MFRDSRSSTLDPRPRSRRVFFWRASRIAQVMAEGSVDAEIRRVHLEIAHPNVLEQIERKLAAHVHGAGTVDRPDLRRAEREQADERRQLDGAGDLDVEGTIGD